MVYLHRPKPYDRTLVDPGGLLLDGTRSTRRTLLTQTSGACLAVWMVLNSNLDMLEKLDRREEGCREREEHMKIETRPKLSEDIVVLGTIRRDRKDKGRKSSV